MGEVIIVQNKELGYIKIKCGHCGHLLKVGRYIVIKAEEEDKFVVKDEESVCCERCQHEQNIPALYQDLQAAHDVQLGFLMFGFPEEAFMPLLKEVHVVH